MAERRYTPEGLYLVTEDDTDKIADAIKALSPQKHQSKIKKDLENIRERNKELCYYTSSEGQLEAFCKLTGSRDADFYLMQDLSLIAPYKLLGGFEIRDFPVVSQETISELEKEVLDNTGETLDLDNDIRIGYLRKAYESNRELTLFVLHYSIDFFHRNNPLLSDMVPICYAVNYQLIRNQAIKDRAGRS